jgi:hypothetical protein
VISSRRSCSGLQGKYLAVVESDIFRTADCTSRTNCMAAPMFGSKSDGFFPVENAVGRFAFYLEMRGGRSNAPL